ncbi:DUF1330 domain-containing protein [Pseudonocardia hispaniensis]|uniref:DUF1330 domain-containing protein n=1 Tax=Pseudonocardia hispaniensis TaxID=904933 RepID=A0ABW1IWF6_9PSEU
MATIHPAPEAMQALNRAVPDDQPIVLLNLLRYREWTQHRGEWISGRECYARYANALLPILMRVGGRLLWRGQVGHVLVGPPDETWHEAVLVGYPSRSAFARMLADPVYRSCAQLRTDALEDSRLIVAVAPRRIGPLAWTTLRLATRLVAIKTTRSRKGRACPTGPR